MQPGEGPWEVSSLAPSPNGVGEGRSGIELPGERDPGLMRWSGPLQAGLAGGGWATGKAMGSCIKSVKAKHKRIQL